MSREQEPDSDKLQQDIDDVLAKIGDFESRPGSRRGPSWVRRIWRRLWHQGLGRLRRRLAPRVRGGPRRRGGEFSARGGYWRGQYITYGGEPRGGVRGWLRRLRR